MTAMGLSACASIKSSPKLAADLRWADATATAGLIASRQISVREAVEAAIARIERLNPTYNFLVAADFDHARMTAAAPAQGPFSGVPTLVKDLNDVAGLVSRRGSRVTRHKEPASKSDDSIVDYLASGAVLLGTSATPEYGLLPDTDPVAFGPTRNPWNPLHSVGGSSGGSAAAVAVGAVPIAHASDGGGSIRMPASCCGLMGLKPSRGRFSRSNYGQDLGVDFCVTRTARDSAAMFAAIEQRTANPAYPQTAQVTARERLPARRIGLMTRDVGGMPCSPDVAGVVKRTAVELARLGHHVEEADWGLARPDFTEHFLVLWAGLAKSITDSWTKQLGRPVTSNDLEPFTLELSAKLGASLEKVDAANRAVESLGRQYLRLFEKYDVVISPVLATAPPTIEWFSPTQPLDKMLERITRYVGYTPINNVAGNCAASLPLGLSKDRLPIGVQFASAAGQEQTLLDLAFQTESAGMWVGRPILPDLLS
jgi:amidase